MTFHYQAPTEQELADFAASSEYDVIDLQTGQVVGHAKTLRRASQSAEKRNQGYGAHRFAHKRVAKEV